MAGEEQAEGSARGRGEEVPWRRERGREGERGAVTLSSLIYVTIDLTRISSGVLLLILEFFTVLHLLLYTAPHHFHTTSQYIQQIKSNQNPR